MLDLEALVGQMQGLAGEVAASASRSARQRDAALRQVETARAMAGLREAVLRFRQEMALPADGRDMGRVFEAPPPEDYTVIATDGSQVAPDYHHIAPWYVVNTGCAVFRYGAPEGRPRCRLDSLPVLLPPRHFGGEEMEPDTDARAVAVAVPGPLEAERLKHELRLAIELLQSEGDPGRTVLLLDGPLVQWRMLSDVQNARDREELLGLFRNLLETSRELRTPVAGFISRSRAVEWVTLLRFTLCPSVARDGALCPACNESLLKKNRYAEPPPEAHHAALAGLRDVELARLLLPENGQRTEVLELKSGVWDRIGAAGAAGFFYLNTGREIARVEQPQWVWEDEALMERLHAVVWDQCASGGGYPMVLAEAHEAAVVRAADRESFYLAIERVLTEQGVDHLMTSAKALSKRRPMA
jgi:hypothetical protein